MEDQICFTESSLVVIISSLRLANNLWVDKRKVLKFTVYLSKFCSFTFEYPICVRLIRRGVCELDNRYTNCSG